MSVGFSQTTFLKPAIHFGEDVKSPEKPPVDLSLDSVKSGQDPAFFPAAAFPSELDPPKGILKNLAYGFNCWFRSKHVQTPMEKSLYELCGRLKEQIAQSKIALQPNSVPNEIYETRFDARILLDGKPYSFIRTRMQDYWQPELISADQQISFKQGYFDVDYQDKAEKIAIHSTNFALYSQVQKLFNQVFRFCRAQQRAILKQQKQEAERLRQAELDAMDQKALAGYKMRF